jgi:hypothetical protein
LQLIQNNVDFRRPIQHIQEGSTEIVPEFLDIARRNMHVSRQPSGKRTQTQHTKQDIISQTS